MKEIKLFIKELKRVRWTKPSQTTKMFFKTILFLLVLGAFLIGIYYLFIWIWSGLGVGV